MPRMMSAPMTPQNSTRCCCSSGTAKIVEDHQEDEKIVDAEREFQNIAGDEFQRDLMSLPEIQIRIANTAARPTYRLQARATREARLARAGERPSRSSSSMAEREEVEEDPEIEQCAIVKILPREFAKG